VARNRVARAVANTCRRRRDGRGSLYADDPKMPVGNCASCHMAKIGKLQDINVDAMYTWISTRTERAPWPKGTSLPRLRHRLAGQSAILKNPIRRRARTTTSCRTRAASVTPLPGPAAIWIKLFCWSALNREIAVQSAPVNALPRTTRRQRGVVTLESTKGIL